MVELLWFIQTGTTLGGNEIHQTPCIKGKSEKFNVREKLDGLSLFFISLFCK